MERKLLLPLVILITLLAACSNETKEAESKDTEDKEATKKVEDSIEELASYEISNEDMFDMYNFKSTYEGDKLIFSGNRTNKRDDIRKRYVITADKALISTEDLAKEDNERDHCIDGELSPDGNYFVFNCSNDNTVFSLYDFDKEEVIYREENENQTFDHYESSTLHAMAITNDQEIILGQKHEGYFKIYDLKDASIKEVDVASEISDDDRLVDIILTDDDSKIFISTEQQVFEYDRSTEKFHPLIDDTDEETRVSSFKMSENGKYATYHKKENRINGPLQEYDVFVNLESGEQKAYDKLDYSGYSTPDDNGNIVFYDAKEQAMFLYNFEIEENKIIPIDKDKLFMAANNFSFSSNGKHLFVYDIDYGDEKTTYTFYRFTFGDIDSYEEDEFRGNLLNASNNNVDENKDNDTDQPITLNDYDEDPREGYKKRWEKSVDAQFPTQFPFEPDEIQYSMYGNRYEQEIINGREEIEYSTFLNGNITNSKDCAADDLEKDIEKDGIEYYYYDFTMEHELAFAKDGDCYTIVQEDFDKETSYSIADSIQTINDPPFDLPIDQIKFPTKLPMNELNISTQHINYNTETTELRIFHTFESRDDKKFNIGYAASTEDTLKSQSEKHEEVESSDWEEITYYEDMHELVMYDGDFYYRLTADRIDNEYQEELGEENIKQILIDVAETMEK
ncbi:hypothetical protein AB4Y30_14685 [Ornithinibacillus sp. 4-3]|uniref:Uncharacterized protein n=1 Tax=Ornithinibacillus sp. 4-3 TaxID=3231488 RepID=A0AB39HR36_9BACI